MKKNKVKKILTIYDLENFYSKYKRSTHFSSKESGYQLAVQIPAEFEKDDDKIDDTILFCSVRFFHTGLNRNKSNVTHEAAEKAMQGMAYKPVLANFCEYEDSDGNIVKDFTAHDMELDENGDIKYIERQIGCITADEPFFSDYEGKEYVCGTVAIPKLYSDAVDIIERKNGTKVSVELLINELSYDAKLKELILSDVIVSGLTCLGINPETGKQVEEGMVNSRLDIKDFAESNNSMFSSITDEEQNKLIDTLERLNLALEKFNINEETQKNSKEGGNETVNKFMELLTKYSKTEEEITFEIEGLSDEELEAKFVEVFGEAEDENSGDGTDSNTTQNASKEGEDDEDKDKDEFEEDDKDDDEGVDEEDTDTDDDEDDEKKETNKKKKCSVDEHGNMSLIFEISHEDVRSALYNLIGSFDELDNEWYFIDSVYDDKFIMKGWCTGAVYGCKYIKDGDNVSLDGERYKLFEELLTESEKAELDNLRSNYSVIETELNTYKENELNAQKEALFSSDDYKGIVETDAFVELKKESKNFSVEELTDKLDKIIAESVKKGTFSFNAQTTEEKKSVKKVNFAQTLVADKPKKNSFLDGLLNK